MKISDLSSKNNLDAVCQSDQCIEPAGKDFALSGSKENLPYGDRVDLSDPIQGDAENL